MGRIWVAFAFGSIGLAGISIACAPEDESHARGDVPEAVAWNEIHALKQQFRMHEEPDAAAVREYRRLLARYWGTDPNADQLELDARLERAAGLRPTQAAAWRALHDSSAAQLVVTWDDERGAPGYVDFGIPLRASTGAAARQRFASDLQPRLAALLDMTSEDELVVDGEEAFTLDDGMGGPATTDIVRVRYRRKHAGVVVFGDWLDVTLRTTNAARDRWQALATARWTPRLGIRIQPQIEPSIAARAAEVEAGSSFVSGEALLGIDADAKPPVLVYRIALEDTTTHDAWLSTVSARDGVVRERVSQVAHYDGSLKIPVSRNYETTKTSRPLPNANIYEDIRYASNTVECSTTTPPTMWQTTGDPASIIGTTNYSGTYSSLVGPDPADTLWTVDFRGPRANDRTATPTLHMGTFPAGTAHTFPVYDAYNRSRRGEIFYLVNYGNTIYRNAYSINQWEPVNFWFWETVDDGFDCATDEWSIECCNGRVRAWGGCFEMWCPPTMGTQASPAAERNFRVVALHEQNHTLRLKTSGDLCWGCSGSPTTDGAECQCWEEGRAMFGALALTQFEATNTAYRPGKTYPADFDTGVYSSGSIWTALYSHFLLNVGVNVALKEVHYNLGNVDTATRMVGACTDVDGDGVEASECPSNSYYRQLLSADWMWDGRYRNQAEISEVFHWHVTDAQRGVAGVQSFPWADETPNHRARPAFVGVDASAVTVTSGIGDGSGSLRFEDAADHDTVMFLARAGESYTVETTTLTSGMDTYLEVLDRNGLETIIASNDDCGGVGPASCITFTAASSGYYRVRAHPVTGSSVGPTKTYRIRIAPTGDDHGDDWNNATALIADNRLQTGSVNAAGDIDFFKFVSSAAQTGSLIACTSTAGALVRIELVDESGSVVDLFDAPSCASFGSHAITVDRGVYFVRAFSLTGGTATYYVGANVTADVDVDSTAANAWVLQDQERTGRVIGGRFDSASDEDWYSFDSTGSGRYYTIETWGVDAAVDTEIEIYTPPTTAFGRVAPIEVITEDTSGGNGLGHWMLKDDNGAIAARGSRTAFLTPVAGTYWVRVRNKSASTGGYRIMIHDGGGGFGWAPMP